jgi:serine/threonine-protein kinase
VAALQYGATYLHFAPRFSDPGAEDLAPRLQVMRAGLLFLAGVGGAIIARVLMGAAEQALREVREQDLMGKYVLHERLGSGGMAEVYRATYCPEGGFQKTVAVKRVLPSLSGNARFAEMFLEEAQLCAGLVHPNVVQVHDCGRFRDSFILAMEFVDGAPLSRIIEGRSLPYGAVTYVGAELSRALDYIHHKRAADGTPLRLVHRDLNPPNVLVSRLGEVKLADFGVAWTTVRARVGERDGFYGKVGYASPEQLAVQPLDGRSDLYLLGLTLQQMLCGGRLPADRSELPSAVPAQLARLVHRLLEERRERRPANAGDVHAELCELSGELAPYPAGARLLAEALATLPPRPSGDAARTELRSTADLRVPA